jgi:hypothetical protein
MIAYDGIVLDQCFGIDDPITANPGTGIDYRMVHDNASGTYTCVP